ncbi:MAG TPA: hypothetical protein VFD39_13555 [Trueperaceae bacterium]|nr:hypothetical protein [Trueperaceae bacterium]
MGEAFLRDAGHYRSGAIAMSDVTTCPISRDEYSRLAMEASGFALTFTEVLTSPLFHCRPSYAFDNPGVVFEHSRAGSIMLDGVRSG